MAGVFVEARQTEKFNLVQSKKKQLSSQKTDSCRIMNLGDDFW